MKKIVCLIAGLLLTAAMASSCGTVELPPVQTSPDTSVGETTPDGETNPDKPIETADSSGHTHTFDEHWTNDETHHWHASACEHGDVVADKDAHVDEDGNDVCDVCGFRNKHEHTYEDTWTVSESTHYYKNTCGHDDVEKYRKDEAKHADQNNDGLCDVCSYDYGHAHTYDTETWVKTEGGHWHAPTCGHDIPGIDKADHADADNNGICDGCAYDYDHTHTWSADWTHDDDYHWHDVTCGHSIDVSEKNAHVDGDGNKICDTCGYEPPHIHEFDSSKWQSDATGHWHASTCGHDVRADETGHNSYEEDGVCDTCQYVVFHFYTVNVTMPEESVMIKAPDGSDALSFVAKEGTDVVFHLTLPRYIEIINMKGATPGDDPVVEGVNHTYTVTVKAIKGDTEVTMELKKNSNVQVIVDYAEATLEVTKKFTNATGQVTFRIPSAGRYIIYANNTDIDFNLAGNIAPQDDTSNAYIFDAPAGDVTLDCTYFAWSVPADNKLVFNYVVARVEKNTTLDSLDGNGCIMPTNYAVNISFKLPSAGFYQIISSSAVSWDGDITQPHFFYVPEGEELQRTIAIKYDSQTEAQFIFDWKIERVAPVDELKLGTNTFVARKGAYTAMNFTAPRDGAFHFTTGDSHAVFFHWVETEWGDYLQRLGSSSIVSELTEGETITLFVTTDPYATDEQIPGNVDCSGYVAYAPGSNGEAVVGMDNAFISDEYEDTEYTLTAMNGDLISIDGGQTWHDEITTIVPGYGALYYQVQSASGAETVVVYIGETTYEITLSLGQNAPVAMIPGQVYVLHLTGAEASQGFYMNYILSWTDANISVTYGNTAVSSGGTISMYTSSTSSLVAVYNGDTEGSVVFTLAEGAVDSGTDNPDNPDNPDVPGISGDYELSIGRNFVEITNGYQGTTVVFTAAEAGTYTIAYAPNVSNGVAYIETATGSEELALPYTVTLAAGESISFLLATLNYEPDSIGIMVTKS